LASPKTTPAPKPLNIGPEAEKELEEDRGKRLTNDAFQDNIELRRRFANKCYDMVSFWIQGTIFLVFLSGCKFLPFRLSDSVLIALISGTVIIGPLMVVVRNLFPSNQSTDQLS